VLIFRFNYDPSVQVPPKVYPVSDVGGADRYKFFRRYCTTVSFYDEVQLVLFIFLFLKC
jgi:hypothetical protein